ncbi:hypothetical protein [Verminephrobacter aporrectodeae]|uniref:hypothetical protein n=1 Tax=Verminephrobacter aporrectodeae TaxID=1110389 RepID=UPI002238FA58|nr:hypothetical protein [Verminephrobacter aporrectodeae]
MKRTDCGQLRIFPGKISGISGFYALTPFIKGVIHDANLSEDDHNDDHDGIFHVYRDEIVRPHRGVVDFWWYWSTGGANSLRIAFQTEKMTGAWSFYFLNCWVYAIISQRSIA